MAVTANFPPDDKGLTTGEEETGTGYWIEAMGRDVRANDGTGAVEVSFKVYSGEPKPSKDITVRYYIDLSEVGDPSVVQAKKLYDQAEAEIKGSTCIVDNPVKWDKMKDVYYVEIHWEDCTFANSGKKCQFEVGFYGKGYTGEDTKYHFYEWNPENDWSFETLKLGTKDDFFETENPPEVLNEHICVYIDGVLVGGTEPDGTKPAEDEPQEPTQKPTQEPTQKPTQAPTQGPTQGPTEDGPQGPTQATASNDKTTLYGDVDVSGKVDIVDVITLNKNLMVGEELKPQGKINADVDNSGKIDETDALNILKAVVEMVTLPIA